MKAVIPVTEEVVVHQVRIMIPNRAVANTFEVVQSMGVV